MNDIIRKTPTLDYYTLVKRRGKYAPLWTNVFQFGLEGIVDPAKAPLIGTVSSTNGGRIGGRYFPTQNSILIYHNNDHFVTLATAVHELAHYQMYICTCDHVPKTKSARVKCRYKGEHSKEFYKMLEPMYKQAQVPTYAARAVEGNYDYPKHWNDDGWR
jgi:hypothetical protein